MSLKQKHESSCWVKESLDCSQSAVRVGGRCLRRQVCNENLVRWSNLLEERQQTVRWQYVRVRAERDAHLLHVNNGRALILIFKSGSNSSNININSETFRSLITFISWQPTLHIWIDSTTTEIFVLFGCLSRFSLKTFLTSLAGFCILPERREQKLRNMSLGGKLSDYKRGLQKEAFSSYRSYNQNQSRCVKRLMLREEEERCCQSCTMCKIHNNYIQTKGTRLWLRCTS